MPINEKDYTRILNDLNKEFDPNKSNHQRTANWIVIVVIGVFLGWLAVVGVFQ